MTRDLWRPRELVDPSMLRPLRPRQAAAIEQIRDAVREGHKRIVLQAPTGFGKTLTAAHLIASALGKGKRAMFTCPAIALVNQTVDAFEREGIYDIGVMQAAHERTDFEAACQIASVQTLIRRKSPSFDFAIIDEAHQQFESLNNRLSSDEWRDKIVIGFTATPWAKGMGLHWSKLIIAATVRELIDEGFLSPFEIFAPAEDVDLSAVKTVAGDYHEGELSDVMSAPKLVADVVRTWREKGEGRSTFLFAVDRAHASALQGEFQQAGISCGYIDGFSTPEERFETFRRFRNGDDRIISSVGCLTTGVDEDVRCIIDAAPTKSEMRHVQKIGRGLRLAEGKDYLLILDHAGNTLRLGMVTDIYHDRLDTRRPGDRDKPEADGKPAPKPRKCKSCGCVMPAGARVCPACGEVQAASSNVLVEDGDLVQFGSGQKGKAAKPGDKQAFYSGALYLAQQHGRQPGWAAHFYKDRFGTWPNNLEKIARAPNQEVKNFDAHRRIAWAKRKKTA